MKAHALIFIVAACLFYRCRPAGTPIEGQVNPILGDISYKSRFGTLPGAQADETTRIQTHLEYVEQLLRSKDVGSLSAIARQRRYHMLSLLHQYRVAGRFPRNYDHPGKRKPCFIDRDGTICAVGYLVEQTGGRQLAELINSRHQYDYIKDMKTPELLSWVAQSGLSLEECAMIQPGYAYSQPGYITPANGVISGAWCGLNTSFAVANCMQMGKPRSFNSTSTAGIVLGLGQVAFGIATLPEEGKGFNQAYSNNAQKNLSFINVGIGTTTMVLSLWNRLSEKKISGKNAVGFHSVPTPGKPAGLAVSLTRKI